jgi:hypothetical protein
MWGIQTARNAIKDFAIRFTSIPWVDLQSLQGRTN